MLAALAAGIIATGTVALAQQSGGSGAIFMYHHVSPTVLPGPYGRVLTITPAEFESQLAWLHAHSCQAVSMRTFERDARLNALAPCEVALTFDDGYDDEATYATPLLQRFGDVGTFYIATGFVGAARHLTLAQLRGMSAAGMEIAAHTVNHVDLTALSRAQADSEIATSGKMLREWLGKPITSFAYPAGQFNAQVESAVRALGFDNAVTTLPGRVTAGSDRFALPRYRVERGQGTGLLRATLGAAIQSGQDALALAHIARARIAGNDPRAAEAIAVALLTPEFPEQIVKVHVLVLAPAGVAGIVLSGVKFHRPLDRQQFAADVRDMVRRAFSAAPEVGEVDIWATVPVAVNAGTTVSGDLAMPTSRTVFSAAVLRQSLAQGSGAVDLGTTYWDPTWLTKAGPAK